MITLEKIKDFFKKGLNSQASPENLAASFSLGIYIAFKSECKYLQ